MIYHSPRPARWNDDNTGYKGWSFPALWYNFEIGGWRRKKNGFGLGAVQLVQVEKFLWYLAAPLIPGYVHKLSIANPPKIVNISFCSLLFVDPLKFQEHIGINVASLRVKTGAFRWSQGNLKPVISSILVDWVNLCYLIPYLRSWKHCGNLMLSQVFKPTKKLI